MLDVVFIDGEEIERFRKDADLVNEKISELYEIIGPIYERLSNDELKNEFRTFLSSVYFKVAKTYHEVVMGELIDIDYVFHLVIENYMHSNNGCIFRNASPELFAASSDLLYHPEFLIKLKEHMLDIYEILTGINIRKTLDEVTESCPRIKDYIKNFKRTDNFYTLIYSIYLNSARTYVSAIMNEVPWDKSVVKTLVTNTLSSILPINTEDIEYEKLVADDEFLDIVGDYIDYIYEKILARVDCRFDSQDNLDIIRKLKEVDRRKPSYII
jgi:hypothetical protein